MLLAMRSESSLLFGTATVMKALVIFFIATLVLQCRISPFLENEVYFSTIRKDFHDRILQ